MRSVFLDYATVSFNGDLDPAALRRAMPGLELRDNTPQDAVPDAIAGATVIVLNKLRITRETIAASPDLKLIVLAATGTNNVDLEAARERGIARLRGGVDPGLARRAREAEKLLATDALITSGAQLADLTPETMEAFNKILPPTWSHNNPVDIIGDASADMTLLPLPYRTGSTWVCGFG